MDTLTRRNLTIAAVVAVLIVMISATLIGSRDDGPAAVVTSTNKVEDPRVAEEELGLARRDADDMTAIGDVDAPLVLIEYADYRCPFCGVFARDTLPQLTKEYIDTGKLRFEWRDFPVFGEDSMAAALAARAAGEQGLFWEYHAAMYEDAPERGHLETDRQAILKWAQQVGVSDLEKFKKDLENPDLRAAVEADAAQARQLGASGTPTFIVGGRPVVGAQPIEAFRQAIDEQLAALEEN